MPGRIHENQAQFILGPKSISGKAVTVISSSRCVKNCVWVSHGIVSCLVYMYVVC